MARLEREFNSLTPFSKSRHICNLDIICILVFSNSSVKLMFLRVYIKIQLNEPSTGTSLAIHN